MKQTSAARPRLLLTHTDAARAAYYGARAESALAALGDLTRHAGPAPLTGDALIAAAQGVAVIVSERASPGDASLFAACPDLIAFVRCAVDIRNVDVAAASAAGVLVTRASPGFQSAVAELIIGTMVDLLRGVSRAVLAYRAGRTPAIEMGRQIAGGTVGIVGFGAIGRRLAALLAPFGATILIADPFATVPPDAGRQVTFADLLARSDIVVCLAIANEETENLFDAQALAAMRPGAFFINASRGDLVDESALAAALSSGHLAGASLDVGRAPDQMPSPELARRPDVIATPHIGGLTPQAVEHQAMETTLQVADILAGRVPPGTVNSHAATRLTRQQAER